MPGETMSANNSFASLGPMLLARKGTAKPAMRAQLGANDRTDVLSDDLAELADSQSALGWNDMGDETNVTSIETGRRKSAKASAPRKQRNPRGHGEAAARRAAFTLRLDAERHLKLRLASTITDESAQALVTEALDRFLDDIPELNSLASQVQRQSDKS